jgi:hypothetical protein
VTAENTAPKRQGDSTTNLNRDGRKPGPKKALKHLLQTHAAPTTNLGAKAPTTNLSPPLMAEVVWELMFSGTSAGSRKFRYHPNANYSFPENF